MLELNRQRCHFAGTAGFIALSTAAALATQLWSLLMSIPVAGCRLAWAARFTFETTPPATSAHPWYSLAAHFVVFRDIPAGRIRI